MTASAQRTLESSIGEPLEIPPPTAAGIQRTIDMLRSWTAEDAANPPSPEEEQAYDELMAALETPKLEFRSFPFE